MILLTTIYDPIKADLLKAYLEANNVYPHTSSDNAGGLEPQLTPLSGVKIFVEEKDRYKATNLLAEFESANHAIDEDFEDPTQ